MSLLLRVPCKKLWKFNILCEKREISNQNRKDFGIKMLVMRALITIVKLT